MTLNLAETSIVKSRPSVPYRANLLPEKELNACWNSVYRKIFGFHKWESVKCCIHGLNRLDLCSIIRLRRVSFYRNIMSSNCSVLRCRFWSFFIDSFGADVLTVYRSLAL